MDILMWCVIFGLMGAVLAAAVKGPLKGGPPHYGRLGQQGETSGPADTTLSNGRGSSGSFANALLVVVEASLVLIFVGMAVAVLVGGGGGPSVHERFESAKTNLSDAANTYFSLQDLYRGSAHWDTPQPAVEVARIRLMGAVLSLPSLGEGGMSSADRSCVRGLLAATTGGHPARAELSAAIAACN